MVIKAWNAPTEPVLGKKPVVIKWYGIVNGIAGFMKSDGTPLLTNENYEDWKTTALNSSGRISTITIHMDKPVSEIQRTKAVSTFSTFSTFPIFSFFLYCCFSGCSVQLFLWPVQIEGISKTMWLLPSINDSSTSAPPRVSKISEKFIFSCLELGWPGLLHLQLAWVIVSPGYGRHRRLS